MPRQISTGFACLLMTSSLFAGSAPDSAGQTFVSGVGRISLIELFTSEGCSSCPPADRWMSRLKSEPRLWKDFVPLAFHVDYWDYIGWQDRFARPEFSQRQRRYAAEGHTPTVYTPGFFRDGSEWRGWSRSSGPEPEADPVGVLSVAVEGDHAGIRFDPQSGEHQELVMNVAVLGMGLISYVTAGENEGRMLAHDFVVLDMISRPLDHADGVFSGSVALNGELVDHGQRALAVWVSEPGDQAPVQAVGGFL